MARWRRSVRVLVVFVAACLLIGIVALESLRVVGARRGVESVPLPRGSEIAVLAEGADYTDSYRVVLRHTVSADALEREAFQKGCVVVADSAQLVYEGAAPGLRFLVSYYLDSGETPQAVTVSTAVFYESWIGRVYFTPVKQVHRRGMPFVVSQMVERLNTVESTGDDGRKQTPGT